MNHPDNRYERRKERRKNSISEIKRSREDRSSRAWRRLIKERDKEQEFTNEILEELKAR